MPSFTDYRAFRSKSGGLSCMRTSQASVTPIGMLKWPLLMIANTRDCGQNAWGKQPRLFFCAFFQNVRQFATNTQPVLLVLLYPGPKTYRRISDMDTDRLLDRISNGELSAASKLFVRHEPRLRRMVRLRLDRRLSARVDPSDIVQEVLIEAHRRLIDYAAHRPLPFYPWLRGIAWDKLIEVRRRHIEAKRRTVLREMRHLDLSGESQVILVDRMMANGPTPSERALRHEMRDRVRQAIEDLPPNHHEVIVLKHLEELSVAEIAAILGIDREAVYSRYRRAVQRLHRNLSMES